MARKLFIVGVDDSGSSTLAQTLRSAGFTCVALPSECAVTPAAGPPGLEPNETCTTVPREELAAHSVGDHAASCGAAIADERDADCATPGFGTDGVLPTGADNAPSCEDEKLGALVRRYQLLSEREREVAALVVEGLLNKQISAELGIAERTVKIHRARTMSKLEVRSLPDLVRYIDRVARVAVPKPCYSLSQSTHFRARRAPDLSACACNPDRIRAAR